MKATMVVAPGVAQVVDQITPTVARNDVLVKVRACGICGSDAFLIATGGLPPHVGAMPLGHEPAGEVVEVGGNVSDVSVGDHVVINPMGKGRADEIIGCGGSDGALSEFLLLTDAVKGQHFESIPHHIPFEVAALNEPLAVARHAVNQLAPKPTDKAVVIGAGPIGLGATIALKLLGVAHVAVADLIPSRLEKALRVGADAVINSAEQDFGKLLLELHGPGESIWPDKVDTDIYLDAAGAPAAVTGALANAKRGAKLGIVAVHKQPVPIDFMGVVLNELTIVGAIGYPTEIFEVTKDLIENWEKYAVIIDQTIPFSKVEQALESSAAAEAGGKVVVTFD